MIEIEVGPRVGSKEDPNVVDYQERTSKMRKREITLASWHLRVYAETQGAVELPWRSDEYWVNVAVTNQVKNEETGKWEYPVDEVKTRAVLSAVAKFASKQSGLKIERKYDTTEFELKVTMPIINAGDDDTVTVKYHAPREVMCTKRVVGTKVTPAQVIPERVEEVVEWDCKPISLLGFDANETDPDTD